MTGETPDCRGCALPRDRRAFLRDAGRAAAGILVALGAPAAEANAMPLMFAAPGRVSGPGKATYTTPSADSVQIDRTNELILARWQNVVYAFELSCPHQNTALRWNEADHRFQCPKHHSQYGSDGVFIEGRSTRSMDRLAIRREGNSVVVDLDTLYKEDENAAEWKAAAVTVG